MFTFKAGDCFKYISPNTQAHFGYFSSSISSLFFSPRACDFLLPQDTPHVFCFLISKLVLNKFLYNICPHPPKSFFYMDVSLQGFNLSLTLRCSTVTIYRPAPFEFPYKLNLCKYEPIFSENVPFTSPFLSPWWFPNIPFLSFPWNASPNLFSLVR